MAGGRRRSRSLFPHVTRLLLHAYTYTPTLTRLHLHAYSYTPTLARLLLHAYTYTPALTRLLLHAYFYTPTLARLLLHAYSYTPTAGPAHYALKEIPLEGGETEDDAQTHREVKLLSQVKKKRYKKQ
jgi:hypothetical protein